MTETKMTKNSIKMLMLVVMIPIKRKMINNNNSVGASVVEKMLEERIKQKWKRMNDYNAKHSVF